MNIKICDIISKILIVVGVITLTGIVNEIELPTPSSLKIVANLCASCFIIYCGLKIQKKIREIS